MDALPFVLQCSKSCGGGTRRRAAVCRKTGEAGGDESKCSQRDKLTIQPCNEFLCPQWKTGDWSEVSYALNLSSSLTLLVILNSFKGSEYSWELAEKTSNVYIAIVFLSFPVIYGTWKKYLEMILHFSFGSFSTVTQDAT